MSRVGDEFSRQIAGEAGLIVREEYRRRVTYQRKPAAEKGIVRDFLQREREPFTRGLFPTILPVATGGYRASLPDRHGDTTVLLDPNFEAWQFSRAWADGFGMGGDLVPSLASYFGHSSMARESELAALLGRATVRVLTARD